MQFLITGGAGSIGSALTKKILKTNKYAYVTAFDSCEYALATLQQENPERLSICLGDIRDRERLKQLGFFDIVIHMAALKRVEMAEANVTEAVKTNVLGTINLLDSVKASKFLLVSSDKAVPQSEMGLYGITKLLQEKIVLTHKSPMKCSVARFGNVIGTRGDVHEIWQKQSANHEPLTLTDPNMKRYFWSMDEATTFILTCLGAMQGQETFIPKMHECNLLDYAKNLYPKAKFKTVGLRSGEVFKHELMTPSERERAKRKPWGWIIK